MHPTGNFVYVVSGNLIFALTVNTSSGALTAAPGSPSLAQNPQGLAVDPKGKFLYVTRDHPDAVSVYTIDSGSGALTPLTSLSVVEQDPFAVAVGPDGKVRLCNQLCSSGPGLSTQPRHRQCFRACDQFEQRSSDSLARFTLRRRGRTSGVSYL